MASVYINDVMQTQAVRSYHLLFYFTGATLLLQLLLLLAAYCFRILEDSYPVISDEPRTELLVAPESEARRLPQDSVVKSVSVLPLQDVPQEVLPEEGSVLPGQEPMQVVKYTVKRGDTFSKIWTLHGGTIEESFKAAAALKVVGISAHSLRSGEVMELAISNGRIASLSRRVEAGRTVILRNEGGGQFSASLEETQVSHLERHVSGKISSSLSSAATEVSVPHSVVDDLVDLFDDRIDFSRELQPGDTFSLIYLEKRSFAGEVFGSGPILAAALSKDGKAMYAVRHGESEHGGNYFDENGQLLGRSFLKYPLKFSRISSVFTDSRLHPILRVRRPHLGVDFAAPLGTPVRTVGDGVVVFAGYERGSGRTVKVRHGERYTTTYCHLSKIQPGLKHGSRVGRGELIGAVGMSGLATGPHLHFGFFDRGRYIDPLGKRVPLLIESKDAIPAGQLREMLQSLDSLREGAAQDLKLASRLDGQGGKA